MLHRFYVITENAEIAAIMTADPNDASAVQEIAWWVVSTNIISTNLTSSLASAPVLDAPCGEIFHLDTKDFWNINQASFADWQQACDTAKKTFTCNNGEWVEWLDYADTETYKYTSCSIWDAVNCIEWDITWTNSIYNYTEITHATTDTTTWTKVITNWTENYTATLSCNNWTVSIDTEVKTTTDCTQNYHLDTTSCVPDTRSCDITNWTWTQEWGWSDWLTCNITSCNDTYHLETNQCLSDTKQLDCSSITLHSINFSMIV